MKKRLFAAVLFYFFRVIQDYERFAYLAFNVIIVAATIITLKANSSSSLNTESLFLSYFMRLRVHLQRRAPHKTPERVKTIRACAVLGVALLVAGNPEIYFSKLS